MSGQLFKRSGCGLSLLGTALAGILKAANIADDDHGEFSSTQIQGEHEADDQHEQDHEEGARFGDIGYKEVIDFPADFAATGLVDFE